MVITLVGVALGGLIGYLSAARIARVNSESAAGAKLRCAFAMELASMRLARTYKSLQNVETLLNDAFPRHAAAIEEYRFFILPKDRAAYQKAWENYYCKGGSVFFLEYSIPEEGEKPHELFEQRVQEILQFTQR